MKRFIILGVVIIIAVAALLLFRNNNSSSPQANNSASSTKSNESNNPPAPPANNPVATDKVTMSSINFSPGNITVKKGTLVTWTNQDAVDHTVTEDDSKTGPSSPPLSQGQSYTFTYKEAGSFHYHCTIHSEMTGTVTVTES